MSARTLPSHDLTLIDDRRLVYEGALDLGGFRGASFRTADGMGVVVSIDPAIPTGEGFHISITRPGHPPSDDDIAVVRIAVCGPGSHVRIVTPATSMLRGQIVHLDEEPDRYDPPDAPWWTQEEFAAVAARMATETGIPATRARANMEHLQRLGLARIERRWDPDHGELVRLDLRPVQWRQERRQHRQHAGQDQGNNR
jgi:hypothetical protein